jgi:hypothetical protein
MVMTTTTTMMMRQSPDEQERPVVLRLRPPKSMKLELSLRAMAVGAG